MRGQLCGDCDSMMPCRFSKLGSTHGPPHRVIMRLSSYLVCLGVKTVLTSEIYVSCRPMGLIISYMVSADLTGSPLGRLGLEPPSKESILMTAVTGITRSSETPRLSRSLTASLSYIRALCVHHLQVPSR